MCQPQGRPEEVESALLEALRHHGGLPALAAYQHLQEKGICLQHFTEAVQSLARRGLVRSGDPSNPVDPALPPGKILELGLEPDIAPSPSGVRRFREGVDVYLDRPLGRGAFGAVYVGELVRNKRPIAVKILNLAVLPTTSIREWFVERFRREPRIIANLNNPHIVRVLDWGEDGDDLWYAMELLDGGTLADRIRKEGKLPASEVRIYFKAMASALQDAFRQGVLHRDIKPRNIFNAGPKLADFGLAKLLPDRNQGLTPGAVTPVAAIVGTPQYIAPERANFQSGDARSDIYSLGATMYHAATGRLLFNLDSGDRQRWYHHHLHEKPRPIFYSVPEFPIELGETIHRCLAKDPNDRFWTFESLLKHLGE